MEVMDYVGWQTLAREEWDALMARKAVLAQELEAHQAVVTAISTALLEAETARLAQLEEEYARAFPCPLSLPPFFATS